MSVYLKKCRSRLSDAIEVHKETIMRETLCVKWCDSIDDGNEWFAKIVTIGGEKLAIYIRKATPDECGQ